MSQLFILNQEHLDKLITSIDELKKLVETQSKQRTSTKSENTNVEIDKSNMQ